MVSMSITRFAVKARDDDVRAVLPHSVHDVAEHQILAPMLERLVHSLGETKIDHAGEHLSDTVCATGSQQLFGTKEAKFVIKFRPDQVSATSPRLSVNNPVRTPTPRLNQVSIAPSSSSGCAVRCITVAVERK